MMQLGEYITRNGLEYPVYLKRSVCASNPDVGYVAMTQHNAFIFKDYRVQGTRWTELTDGQLVLFIDVLLPGEEVSHDATQER